MKTVCLMAVLVLCTCLSRAAEERLHFTISSNPGSVTLSLNTGGSSTDEVSHSGYFFADVKFDDETLALEGFKFTSGRIRLSDTSFSLTSDIFYEGQGTFRTDLNATSGSIVLKPDTIPESGFVNPDEGKLDSEEHRVLINEGSSTTSITINGQTDSETHYFQFAPAHDVWVGEKSISVKENSRNRFERELIFTFEFRYEGIESVPLEGTNAIMTFDEQSSFTATATAEVQTPYGAWVEEHELDLLTGLEANEHGLEYPMLYAMGLPPDATRLPVRIEGGQNPTVYLQLPDTGLVRPLKFQMKESLEEFIWNDLPEEYFASGQNPMAVGDTGEVCIQLPDSKSIFIRLWYASAW